MNRIPLQSFDLFSQIEKIHRKPAASLKNIRAKYILLYKVLEQACYELTADVTFSFANLFSRLDYACKEAKMNPSDRYAIQTMRRNCNKAMRNDFCPDMDEYLYDLRALVRFVSLGFKEDIPASILPEIPHSNRPHRGTKQSRIPYLRASVGSWTDTQIFAATDSDEDPFIVIDYSKGGYNEDLGYLKELLTENLPINLLDVNIDENNHYLPSLIVTNPDYLIDISSLAACFQSYGHNPLNYFINKIKPKLNTAPILLGNLASQFLDDYVNERSNEPVTYSQSIKKFVAANAMDFCTCHLLPDFHLQAQTQMMHIRKFIHDILPHNIEKFDKKKNLLEASFICEPLGVQGRVDMLQKDFSVLIEQKSGKRDEYKNRHREDHFIQMMLYQGVLAYNFGMKTHDLQAFLLYSKYADGLMAEHFYVPLFRECIRLRNYIVSNEYALSEGGIASITENLSTDLLNELQAHGKLWTDYQEPELQKIIDTLKRCSPLEKAYFQRFFTFISKELLLSKTGGKHEASKGFAGTWHIPLNEKIEAGNILLGLTISDKRKSDPGKGYDIIELKIPQQREEFLPNFRTGDLIILYSYQDYPDLRKQILMKGNILDIQPEQISILLRNGQQNKDIIGGEGETFAIEHDASDISAVSALKGLFAFLAAPADRKKLLFGQRMPSYHEDRKLNGLYGDCFDELILKEKQAKDYFLLVGPPGTGKTSCALRYMVEEELSEEDSSILLLSYTNRAVDEICNMLVSSGIAAKTPFIRIGHELSCDKRFTPFLLKNRLKDCPKLVDIRQRIQQTRIFVGTTSSINNRLNLFHIKRFNLAIIDEASQILEPDLVGILSAWHGTQTAIDKFILIGDYKQLPAISQQSAEEAAVNNPLLQGIGLNDCRNSLFERLYKQSDLRFRSILHKQGRMHPAIAEFPNHTFYANEHLEPIPLPHQEEANPYSDSCILQDNIDRLLITRRMVFIPAEAPETPGLSEKTNSNEARIVTKLLQRIYRLTAEHFNPYQTVGVIVPYRNQIAMIRKEISLTGIPELAEITIDTVERYQGSQRDVIIYSFTIQNFSQLNFLTANTFQEGEFTIDRKLNVALTRARKQLILTGNPNILGANLTFFKLMEYIRMNNGYIETTTEDFCWGLFNLPEYDREWDLKDQVYTLPEHFKERFEALFPAGDTSQEATVHKEAIGYGRMDCSGAKALSTLQVHLYNLYYARKQYLAAQALYEACGAWLGNAIRNVSGRVVFCDLANETGISGLAFADMCRRFHHMDMTYVGIAPSEQMEQTAKAFFQAPAYSHVYTDFYPRLQAVKPEFWQTHSVLSELIIFNLSNLFDRISSDEARSLALQINQLVHARPLNHYLLIYRDDAGVCANVHSYTAFCSRLSQSIKPVNPQMPLKGNYYYSQCDVKAPPHQEFLYEVRSNK